MNLFDMLQLPQNRLDIFLRTTEIASYMPGRIRVYSRSLIGNEEMERRLRHYLGTLLGIVSVETSTATGSILICYTPEILRCSAELARTEEYIRLHAKRRN